MAHIQHTRGLTNAASVGHLAGEERGLGMNRGWQQTLLSEQDLVKRAAAAVPRMLAHPAVAPDQVSRLRSHIDDCIARLASLSAEMELATVDRVWIDAANAMQGIWENLALDAIERERSLQLNSLDVRYASTDNAG